MNTPGATMPSGAASVAAGLKVHAAGKSGQWTGGWVDYDAGIQVKATSSLSRWLIGGADASKVMFQRRKRGFMLPTLRYVPGVLDKWCLRSGKDW